MGIFHKIKKAGKHVARMGKYAVEEGGMSHEERVARREEIRSSDMSEKEKRERIRAMKETTVAKKAGKIISKL